MCMGINIHIKTKHIDLTPAITATVHERISSIEAVIPPQHTQEALAEVELGLESQHHHKGNIYRAEINLSIGGALHRASAEAETIVHALDQATAAVSQHVVRSSEKKHDLFKKGNRIIKKLFTGK